MTATDDRSSPEEPAASAAPAVEPRPAGIRLPHMAQVRPGWRRGRCPYEGYQRGWGLEFGDLRQQVEADPLYREAADLAGPRSLLGGAKRHNLFLLLRIFLGRIAFGHIIELGVHRGGNVLFMAHVARVLYPSMRVYALDTYAGMPETDGDVDAHRAGDFEDADLEGLRASAREAGLSNIVFCEGLFEDTAPDALLAGGAIALAHVDCDIRSAVAYGYEAVRPFMVPGGYIVFDDATVSSCLGATEAVEELVIARDGLRSEQIYPHFVFRAPGYR
ncbi:MAG: TylF/MycF/NovP-related O-methyltransferase [Myxococcota bacterium]